MLLASSVGGLPMLTVSCSTCLPEVTMRALLLALIFLYVPHFPVGAVEPPPDEDRWTIDLPEFEGRYLDKDKLIRFVNLDTVEIIARLREESFEVIYMKKDRAAVLSDTRNLKYFSKDDLAAYHAHFKDEEEKIHKKMRRDDVTWHALLIRPFTHFWRADFSDYILPHNERPLLFLNDDRGEEWAPTLYHEYSHMHYDRTFPEGGIELDGRKYSRPSIAAKRMIDIRHEAEKLRISAKGLAGLAPTDPKRVQLNANIIRKMLEVLRARADGESDTAREEFFIHWLFAVHYEELGLLPTTAFDNIELAISHVDSVKHFANQEMRAKHLLNLAPHAEALGLTKDLEAFNAAREQTLAKIETLKDLIYAEDNRVVADLRKITGRDLPKRK
jgi:hypothetical protein